MPKVFSNLDDELYARIVWGEYNDDLRDWLIEKGLTREEAIQKIRETKSQLRKEARDAARREMIRGATIALTFGAALIFWSYFSDKSLFEVHWTRWAYEFGSYTVFGIAIGLLDILVGVYRFITGTEGISPSEYRSDYDDLL